MLSNHLVFCCPFFSCPQSFPASGSFPTSQPKYWSFSISPSNEYSGLISFRIDWFDVLAVKGTLKNLLHHHSSKASILQCSAFFMVQLSHLYMITGKNIALTIQTFVGKLVSLLFNTLYRFVGASGKKHTCRCRICKRRRFPPWVGKVPWRRAWQSTPVFLPGESPWTEPGGL